jgi:hypothetical protein
MTKIFGQNEPKKSVDIFGHRVGEKLDEKCLKFIQVFQKSPQINFVDFTTIVWSTLFLKFHSFVIKCSSLIV